MNREDCVVLLSDYFFEVEKNFTTQLEYLCFSVVFGDSKKRIDIVSFLLGKERIRVYPNEFSVLNSKALLSRPKTFFRVENDENVSSLISSIFPQEFDVSEINASFERHKIDLENFADYVQTLSNIKTKKSKK